jgi:hypothetical protein
VKNGDPQLKQPVTLSGSVMGVFIYNLSRHIHVHCLFAAFFHAFGDNVKHVHHANTLYMWEGR